MLHLKKWLVIFMIPFVLSLAAALTKSVALLVIYVAVHFVMLKLIPDFKGKESVWMFVLVAASTPPVNVFALVVMNEWGYVFGSVMILGVLKCILYYMVLLSVEEVAMGVITRLIWRNQQRLTL